MGYDKEKNKKGADQYSRFLETARALGCDEDKDKFEAQLGKIAAHKSAPAKCAKSKRQRQSKTGG
jgi:hypothetical protein